MSEAQNNSTPSQQVNPVDNDASFVVPQSVKSNQKYPDIGHSKLFRYRKWLMIGAGSVVAIGAVVAIVVAINASLPTSTNKNSSTKPTPGVAQVTTTHDEGDDAFFADLPLSMVYYSYSQTTNNKNVFQANPKDSESRFLNIGFPDRYSFSTSPSGNSLIRWDEQTVEVAAASKPASFQSLFKPQGSQITIRSIVWSTDSSRVAVSYTKAPVDTTKLANVVTIVEVPTGNSTTLLEEESDFVYDLMALVDNSRLFYRQDRNGLYSNLTEYSVFEQKISRQLNSFNNEGLLSKLTFNSKMTWAYTYESAEIVRYNIATFERQVVYSLDRSCGERRAPNNSAITSLSVSPTSDQLLFTVIPQACRAGGSKEADLRPKLYAYNVADKSITKELANPPYTKLSSSSWSPNNSMVWMQVDTQTAYGLNPTTLEIWSIPPTDRNTLTKERPLLLGWLIVKK